MLRRSSLPVTRSPCDRLTLLKTSLLNAIAVAVRMLTLLGINKVLAIYVGPAGYAAFGQFQNVVQMISTLANGAINTGVTKYTAEYQDDEYQQRRVWQTAGTMALFVALILSALVFLFREQLAIRFLRDASLITVFEWFAATLVLFVFNTLLLAILNGKKDIHRYVLANIAGSLSALFVTVMMVVYFGLLGALIALVAYQSIAFFVTLLLCLKTEWFRWDAMIGPVDGKVAKNLAKYAVMALTSSITVPMSQILIRDHIGQTLGMDAAGHWEAMWRLSGAYLMLFTSILSVYYLPRLSELKKRQDLRGEIFRGYILILPVAILTTVLIYFFRNKIILFLFSLDFLGMRDLFFWQLIGDLFKIASWFLAYVMIAKTMTFIYIVTEIFFAILIYQFIKFSIPFWGLEAAAISHAATYFIYLICVYIIIKKNKLI